MSRSGRARLNPTVAHVALLLPWITAVVAARLPIRDNSFLWHVTAGRLQIEQGGVLAADPFSFTFGGQAWRTQSWLLELGYAIAESSLGLGAIAFFLGACATATFALILVVTYRLSRSVEATAIVGVLTAWLSAAFLSPRPVLASYLLFALVVAACVDRRTRWALPLIVWVWASVHGSFVLGIGYVVLYGLRRREWSALPSAAAMAVTASLTAHGLGLWRILFDFAGSQGALDLIVEWATPDFTDIALVPFLVGILLLIVAAHRGGLTASAWWVVFPFLVFAFTATRAVYPAWIALAPFVGLAFVGMRRATLSGPGTRRVLVVVAAALIGFPFFLMTDDGALSDTLPINAAEALTAERVFHDDFVGGYLIYAFGPERQVFIDDRAELYGEEFMRDMSRARNGTPVWERVFDEWRIEQALVQSEDGLIEALLKAGWQIDYEDERFSVLSPNG